MNNNGNSKRSHRIFQTVRKQINNDCGHGDSQTTLPTPVEVMTSRDFHMDFNAHIEMMNQVLRDSVRINAFKSAILYNKHLFKGKYVLNIGCGTGIYSLFAAKAGAAKVFAVDTSNVVYYTKQIVQANGYSKVIKVIKGEIEEIELPVPEVDIIICDWMGYALLYQSTCDSVIYARDKWLKKPGGLIFPDIGKLYMVGLEDTKHKNGNINWWSDVCGFNMRCLREVALIEPRCQTIRPDQVISKPYPIKSLNLNTATLSDLRFRSKFMLPIQKTGNMDGIALYFHVYFSQSHTPLVLKTDPWSPRTNWLQTILFFDQTLSVNAGSVYYGGIEFTSLANTLNLNDIIVNLEMLLGDPTQADLEMDMTWHFKLTTGSTVRKKNSADESKNKSVHYKTKETTRNQKKNSEQTDSKNRQEITIVNKNIKSNTLMDKNVIRCSSSLVSPDNLKNTITIDQNSYPFRKNKYNKCTYSKRSGSLKL